MNFHNAVFCLVSATMIFGIVKSPWRIGPWVWAVSAAVIFLLTGIVSPAQALHGIAESGDVAAFLTGMMLLAEFARSRRVFDWLADQAAARAKGSTLRLFALIYAVGIAVTAFLSNDAAAVVLTPAVAAVVRKAKVDPWPHVLACAFIANAASFLLPIANPANLVVYGVTLPGIAVWLAHFFWPSLGAIAVTFMVLLFCERKRLAGKYTIADAPAQLDREGYQALWGLGFTSLVLIVAMKFRWPLGAATFIASAVTVGISMLFRPRDIPPLLRAISWDIIFFVAGLFVFLAACDNSGVIPLVAHALQQLQALAPASGLALLAASVTALCALVNNLPVGLLARTVLAGGAVHLAPGYRDAVLIIVDLGPNLAVTSSLATLLWMDVLRREEIPVDAVRFLRIGLIVTPLSLAAALVLSRTF